MKKSQTLIILAVLVLIACFFIFDLGHYLNLQYLKQQQSAIASLYQTNPLMTAVAFFAIYVLIAGLSLPGAAILTLAGGAVFGLLWGTVLVSFASTIGASIAFVISRYVIGESVQKRFSDKLAVMNKGIEEEGAFYLLTLRLVPVIPFFIVNLLMGMTKMRLLVYFLVSQAGMLAGTIVYVNAGTQLAKIDSLKGILSFELLISFVLLGLFPLLAKKVVGLLRKRTGEKENADVNV